MINHEIAKLLMESVRPHFPKAFITLRLELVLEPNSNTSFILADVKNKLDFERKMVSWASRHCCKGVSMYRQKEILKGFNGVLGTDFNRDDMELIYTYLGNGCNESLCIDFIKSGYDLSLIKDHASVKDGVVWLDRDGI